MPAPTRDELRAQLGAVNAATDFDDSQLLPFSVSLDGLEGVGKTHFIIKTMPRPLVIVNFGDRSPHQFLYRMTPEEREGIVVYDIQPATPDGWTPAEAIQGLIKLSQIITAEAPYMRGGTFALDGGSSWWSVMQQVYVEPKEKERAAKGQKQVGGIIYEEANGRVRGVLGNIKSQGCFLAMTHQMKQDWDAQGPIPGQYSPKKNSQVPFIMEVEVTLYKLCKACNAPDCRNLAPEHMGRRHMSRVKKLSGNTGLEGIVVENLDFAKLYNFQTGKCYVCATSASGPCSLHSKGTGTGASPNANAKAATTSPPATLGAPAVAPEVTK
jgi:hypothetical protein